MFEGLTKYSYGKFVIILPSLKLVMCLAFYPFFFSVNGESCIDKTRFWRTRFIFGMFNKLFVC